MLIFPKMRLINEYAKRFYVKRFSDSFLLYIEETHIISMLEPLETVGLHDKKVRYTGSHF